MFLSKIGEVYYLFFSDETKTRHKVSTKCRKKSEALVFLQQFKRNEFERRKNLKTISLSDFRKQFPVYSSGIHSPKTMRSNATVFTEFIRVEGNRPLHSIGIREIEHFLSVKMLEASVWTSRKYYGSLAAAFEKAVQWNYLETNTFRKVSKPQGREIIPVFLLNRSSVIFYRSSRIRTFGNYASQLFSPASGCQSCLIFVGETLISIQRLSW